MSIIETTPHPQATQRQTLGEFTFDGVIAACWRKGLDTLDISRALGGPLAGFPESRVANRLAYLRDIGTL
jgi:hypothetical protein